MLDHHQPGGCNTAAQVALYFQDNYQRILRSHRVQYNCWVGPQAVSAGGNCCAGAISTGIDAPWSTGTALRIDEAEGHVLVHDRGMIDVVDASGRLVRSLGTTAEGAQRIPLAGLGAGAYLVRERDSGRTARFMVGR